MTVELRFYPGLQTLCKKNQRVSLVLFCRSGGNGMYYDERKTDRGLRFNGELAVYRRVHETPSGNQTDFFYCNQSRNGLTLSTFRDSTLKNMPAGQWRCIIGQTDTLLSVSSRTASAPRCFSLKSGAITTTPQCKCGCLRAMTYRQADTPLPSKSERSERRRQ